MLALTMAPSEFGALLDAIGDVGNRVDGLRKDVFATVDAIREDHGRRITSLEITRERGRAISEAIGERRKAVTIKRKWLIGLAIPGILATAAVIVDLLRLLTGTH